MRTSASFLALVLLSWPGAAAAQVAPFTFPAQGDAYQGPGGARMFDVGDGVAGSRSLHDLEECDVVRGGLVVNTSQFLPNPNCAASFELRVGGVRAGAIAVDPVDREVQFSFDLPGGVGGPDYTFALILERRLAVGCGFIQIPLGRSAWECEDRFAEGDNRRPTCDIGGPYACDEGGAVRLITDALDPDDGPEALQIGYDFDGDDDYSDAGGLSPDVDCALFDGPLDQVIRMRATDTDKERICETRLVVANLPPDVSEPWRPPLQAGQEIPFRYCLNAEDPSPLDEVTYTITRGPDDARMVQADEAGDTGCLEWTPGPEDLGPHEICVRISDGDGGQVDRCWPITVVENPNSPAAFAGEDQTVEPCAVRLCCQGTDPRGLPLNYLWAQTQGPVDVFIDAPEQECMDVAISVVGEYRFECIVENGELTSPPDEMRVTVNNQPPTCDAGFDFRCFTGERCILDGRRSADPNNDPMFFRWLQSEPQEPRLAIPGFTNKIAGFFSNEPGIYCFQLECRDQAGGAAPDEVCVTVNQRAKPAQREEDEDVFQDSIPVAHCGRSPQLVDLDAVVTLDGSRSYDPDGNPLVLFEWTLVSGPDPDAVIQAPDNKVATFAPSEEGVYVVALRVQDSPPADIPNAPNRWSTPCHAVIQAIAPDNTAPIADAGQLRDGAVARKGAFAVLNGARSRDPDGDPITYRWRQVRGPRVALLDGETATPSFAACTVGIYQFELIVNDGRADSLPAEVWATVHSECNLAPVADAGKDEEAQAAPPGNVDPNARVRMDGRNSHDPDELPGVTSLKYQWMQVGGIAEDVELAFTRVPYFEPLLWDIYRFRLFALDSWDDLDQEPDVCWEPAWSLPDDVFRIVHSRQNHVPVADAGVDTEWLVGDNVVLNGCESRDGDGDELVYRWRQVDGPAVVLEERTTCQPTFPASEAERWCFELRVDDTYIESLPDTVCHNAIPNNNVPPVARCGDGDIYTRPGLDVTLDGKGSFDPNGDTLTHRWEQTCGAPVLITGADRALASFRAPQLAADEESRDLCFRLAVNDGRTDDVTCVATVHIERPVVMDCDDLCPETVADKCLCPAECRPLGTDCGPDTPGGGGPTAICRVGDERSCPCAASAECNGVAQCVDRGTFREWGACDCTQCAEGGEGPGAGVGGGASKGLCAYVVGGRADAGARSDLAFVLLALAGIAASRRRRQPKAAGGR